MKGITLAIFRKYVKPSATKEDLRNITNAQVSTVYRRQYWDAVAGAELPGGVDLAVFDFAVNSGPSRAIRYLQAVVGAKRDGKIGPATLAAVRSADAISIIDTLCDKRMAFLKGLGTWNTFGKGWTKRVAAVRTEAKKMAALPPEPVRLISRIPDEIDDTVKEKTDIMGYVTGGGGAVGVAASVLSGWDWQAILAIGGLALVILVILILLRSQIIAAIRSVRNELAEE